MLSQQDSQGFCCNNEGKDVGALAKTYFSCFFFANWNLSTFDWNCFGRSVMSPRYCNKILLT